jgi:signal transduction histidine kinase
MRERLRELEGSLEIESDGRGTSMRATVPLYAMGRSIQSGDCGQANEAAQA